MTVPTLEEARLLPIEAHSDCKILKRILPRKAFAESDGRKLLKGVIIDTETTGIQPEVDSIIELGMYG